MRRLFFLSVTILMVACTSVQVQEVSDDYEISHVCIEDNPKVIVGGFVPVVRKGFERHGITTEVYEDEKPSYCEYHLTYTALKAWDIGTYMHHAELRLYKEVEPIAYAEYHLNGKGGFALNKWASVHSKMDPVIDKLLAHYTPEMVDTYRIPIKDIRKKYEDNSSKSLKLREIKQWFDEGLISENEYNSEKKKVLGE